MQQPAEVAPQRAFFLVASTSVGPAELLPTVAEHRRAQVSVPEGLSSAFRRTDPRSAVVVLLRYSRSSRAGQT